MSHDYADLYDEKHRCTICGKECLHGIARENHARKHQREGTAAIRGFGGPDGRVYIRLPSSISREVSGK